MENTSISSIVCSGFFGFFIDLLRNNLSSIDPVHEPCLRQALGFIGITDVTFIHAEGLNLRGDAAGQGLAKARKQLAAVAWRLLAPLRVMGRAALSRPPAGGRFFAPTGER